MPQDDDRTPPPPRWDHDSLDETLGGARELTVDATDRIVRGWWEDLAPVAGISSRRWRRHHPLGPARAWPLIALVDDRPAFDTAAWARFASLVPGAVALGTRTAASLGVDRAELQPPGRRPLRPLDLVRARRRAGHLRRAERALEGDLAAFRFALGVQVEAALAPGEDGTEFEDLPTYALAARFDDLVHTEGRWSAPALVELAGGDATARLARLLREAGVAQAALDGELARRTAGGGVAVATHLAELAEVAAAPDDERPARLEAWVAAHGWHAMRDLHLEAPPLRDRPDDVAALLAAAASTPRSSSARADAVVEGDRSALGDATRRARRLTALREEVARDRADLHAALRAVAWTLARRLVREGRLRSVADAFDLSVAALLATARGASSAPEPRALGRATPPPSAEPAPAGTVLRGTPASAGIATGRVVVLDDLSAAVDLTECVLVCRHTDPAWTSLLTACLAVVTERGGPLSHAAIVARELGVPAVVAVPDARALAAGASRRARVDGAAGTVTLDPDA